MTERPTEIECESCGAMVPVAAKGRVPTRCTDCRIAGRAREAGQSAGSALATAVNEDLEQQTDAGPVDDGWPKRIAPCAWLDQDGNRYTDMGQAHEAAERIRSRS